MKVTIEGVACEVPYAYARYPARKIKAVRDLVLDLKRRTKDNPTLKITVIRVGTSRIETSVVYGWTAEPNT